MKKSDYYINDTNYTEYIKPITNKIKEDLTGNIYGEWKVKGYFGNKLWLCRCSCGRYNAINRYTLVNGESKSCGHKYFNDLSDTYVGEWYIIRYLGNQHYECRCSCGNIRSVHTYSLTSSKSKSCGHNKNVDLYKGKTYWEWEVLDYYGEGKYICKCSCGNIRQVEKASLLNGRSKSCGHSSNDFIDIKDQIFGELKVLEYIGDGKWKCECSCHKQVEVYGSALRIGRTTSCGHTNKRIKDIKDQKFGKWTVKEYLGKMKWKCECECGQISDVYGHSLRSGKSSRCTKCATKKSKQTLLDRYGDITPSKILNPREQWQIETINSKENLKEFILALEEIPTVFDLQCMLNINKSNMLEYIHKYKLDSLVRINSTESSMEECIINYIETIYRGVILHGNRDILGGRELDIYIPEKKIAIEFNGDYWHSDCMKDKKYHQQKTLDCAKQGIQLIHIFEYEWNNEIKKDKILNYIRKLVMLNSVKKIYARKTTVVEVSKEEAKDFIDKHHLQNYIAADINIGLIYNNELVSVLSLGKPRFNNYSQYEIIRYCNRDDIVVVGGLEKLFNYFKLKYSPESVITYSDLSKFNGNCYLKIGFKTNVNMITEPNYVWVSPDKATVLSRYQCQKHKLLVYGLGGCDETEDEIMRNLGFLRVYDSGNLRLEWYKG